MAEAIILPRLGHTMEEATVVSFNVNKGDWVNKGDCVFEIETEKTALEVQSPSEGFVKKILVKAGETIAVNTAVLVLGGKKERVSRGVVKSLRQHIKEEAEAYSVDETELIEEDLPESAYHLGMRIPLSQTQREVTEKMLSSKRTIPCFYLETSIEVTRALGRCTELSNSSGLQVTIDDLIVQAVARGLKEHPVMTGRLSGEAICFADEICVGLILEGRSGPAAVAMADVCGKSITQITAWRNELMARASEEEFSFSGLDSACITVSSLNAGGADLFVPVVVPGQCSILGVGAVKDRCMPAGGDFIAAKSISLALSVDHRVANGAEAARFLDYIKAALESPENFA